MALGSPESKIHCSSSFLHYYKGHCWGPFASSEYELTEKGWGGTLDLLFVFPFRYYYSASSHSLQNRISRLSWLHKETPPLCYGIYIQYGCCCNLLSIVLAHFSKQKEIHTKFKYHFFCPPLPRPCSPQASPPENFMNLVCSFWVWAGNLWSDLSGMQMLLQMCVCVRMYKKISL